MVPDPEFQIHVDTAKQYGLSNGDMAEIETPHGKIRLKTRLTQNIRLDTVQVVEGWEEANANELTGSNDVDPLSGFPNLKSLKCRVNKL
jgi:anaerobic selenocysteine-containing dehydrogenase